VLNPEEKNIKMIRNYLKIAIRNLRRNPTFSIINVLGLTLGLAITSLIAIYVMNELTYDSFHKDSQYIYRLYKSIAVGSSRMMGPRVNAPLGPYLVENYPNVITQTRISDEEKHTFWIGDKSFEENLIYADSSFFRIFTLDFVYGDPKSALVEPFSLVLTEKCNQKITMS